MKSLLTITALLLVTFLNAQDIPLHDYWNRETERVQLNQPTGYITSYKPLLQSQTRFQEFSAQSKDTVPYYWNVTRILFRDHWLAYKKEDVFITVDPWVDFSFYKDQINTAYNQKVGNLYNNSRGAWVQGRIGSNFSFHTAFSENQSVFPFFMSSLSDSLNVIPGMGRFKAFKKYGFDYAISSSNINFEPHSKLQISLGYGRQMIGNGYRSILLSDAAMNYPMVSARYSGKWFTYISSIALLQEQQRLPLGSTSESLFKRKLGSWNYLVITPHPNLEIGAMESVGYSIWNSKGRQAPHYSVYIPIIGARSLFSSNEKCVTMYGLNAKWNAFHQFTLYAQYALMINSSKSTGVQAGVLFNNFLTQNLDVRIEFNTTSPYMYSTTLDLLSYTQQQQTLGHPSGGDMNEWLVRVDYEKKRYLLHADIHQINQTIVSSSDPYQQQFFTGQKGSRSLLQWQLQLGYLINPKVHLCAWVGYTSREDVRNFSSNLPRSSFNASLFTINLSSALGSRYFDF